MVGSSNPTQLAAEISAYMEGSLGSSTSGIGDISGGSVAQPMTSNFSMPSASTESSSLQDTAHANPVIQSAASVYTETGGQAAIEPIIKQLASEYGLPPTLVTSLVQQESGFSPNATSSAGAMGLMQLMPATAASLGVTNPYDPVSNLRGGMQYLSGLLKRFNGSVPLALAAYNAGPGAVELYGGIPPYPETQSYVRSILSRTAPV
jgi:soluble lytic murein transglycosylase-like protein